MSFALDVKNEICSLSYTKLESTVLLSAFVRNNYTLENGIIKLTTENPKVARFLFTLFKILFDVNAFVEGNLKTTFGSRTIYQISINDKVDLILKSLMVKDDTGDIILEIPHYFVDSFDLVRAYLSGSFLACGSVNDPKKSSYHLEFLVDLKEEAEFLVKLFIEAYVGNLSAKMIRRDKGYMVYIKESSKIADFLRLLGVNRAVLYYEDIRIYRDHKNMTNRLNNCEQANVDKTILACEKQINDINIIEEKLGLDLVDEKLKDVIIYRKKYPDLSLDELSRVISYETGKELTKSGLNHRLRKIKEIANRLKEEN